MHTVTRIIFALAALSLSACAAHGDLTPASGANLVPSLPGEAAAQTQSGVRVVASAGAWDAYPPDLSEVLPLLVQVENTSDAPLQVRFDAFALRAPDGERYAALPPFRIDATEIEPVTRMSHTSEGFFVAPYGSTLYPTMPTYAGEFPYDPIYYNTYYPRYRRVDLPTPDMLSRALPEGVLEPGGRMTGFLYFESVPEDAAAVLFEMKLVDARTGEGFGAVAIPFHVE